MEPVKQDPSASSEVEAPDADLVYDRLWFIASVIATLGAALALRIGCGERLAWVWLAEQLSPPRKVALKILLPPENINIKKGKRTLASKKVKGTH